MTQDQILQLILSKLTSLEGKVDSIDLAVKDLQRFAVEQKERNVQQDEINAKLLKFMDEQKETNKNLEFSHAGLIKMIEEEIIQRLDVKNEKASLYTDYKVRDHEERYQHIPVSA